MPTALLPAFPPFHPPPVNDAHAPLLLAWLQRPADWADPALRQALAAAGPCTLYRATEGDETRLYLPPEADAGALRRLLPAARWLQLQPLWHRAGEAAGQPAPWHYVVATDVLPEHEDDFNAWYQTEHAPGLAAVPGTVQASRWLCEGESPRYHACYDLARREAFGSPPWLAVRATDWSSRVRPHFRNTHRTLFQRIALPAEASRA